MTGPSAEFPRLYLIADPCVAEGDLAGGVLAAIASGVSCVQVRWKSATDRQYASLARQLLEICAPRQVPLIVNDRVDIALAIGAQGVHLGVDDLAVDDARKLGGPVFIIGYSPEADAGIATAAARGATYLGLGPFAHTRTKRDAGGPLGPVEFARRRNLTTLPVVAIGGIDPGNAKTAMDAGASGIAVASAILGGADPAEATRLLMQAISPGHS